MHLIFTLTSFIAPYWIWNTFWWSAFQLWWENLWCLSKLNNLQIKGLLQFDLIKLIKWRYVFWCISAVSQSHVCLFAILILNTTSPKCTVFVWIRMTETILHLWPSTKTTLICGLKTQPTAFRLSFSKLMLLDQMSVSPKHMVDSDFDDDDGK